MNSWRIEVRRGPGLDLWWGANHPQHHFIKGEVQARGVGGAQRLNLTRYRSLNYSSVVRKISIRATCVDAIRDLIFLSFLQKDCKFVKIFDKIKHQTETPAIFFPQHFICWKRCLALFLFLWRKLKTYLFLAFASFSFGEKKNMQICLFVIFFFLSVWCKVCDSDKTAREPKERKVRDGREIRIAECGMLSQLWMRQYNYDMEMMLKEESWADWSLSC